MGLHRIDGSGYRQMHKFHYIPVKFSEKGWLMTSVCSFISETNLTSGVDSVSGSWRFQ